MVWWRKAATVSSWTMCSRVLGLVRDRTLGATFGAGPLLDAFMLAFQLPNLLRNLFGEGALTSAFVPRYVRLRDRAPVAGEAWAGLVLTRLALVLAVIAALGAIAAALVILWSGAERAVLVASLALPQVPYLFFICLSAVMAGALNARGHFAVPAAAPVILNLVLIGAVMAWPTIWILPWAVLVTGVLQLLLHLSALAATGGVPPPRLRGRQHLRSLRRALFPTLVAASAFQVNALLDSLIAYLFVTDGPGAVSILYFANRLYQFPMALVGHAVITAAYPTISRAATDSYRASGRALAGAGGLLALLLFPATIGLVAVAEPLVDTIYRVGAFDHEAAARTVLATRCFALGLVPVTLGKLLVRVFHAHLDQRTPMRISVLLVVANLALNLMLVHTPLREAGLALASGLTAGCACLTYLIILARRGAGTAGIVRRAVLPLIASLVMGLTVLALLTWWPAADAAGTLLHGLRLAVAVVLGVIVYGLLMSRRIVAWWRFRRAEA